MSSVVINSEGQLKWVNQQMSQTGISAEMLHISTILRVRDSAGLFFSISNQSQISANGGTVLDDLNQTVWQLLRSLLGADA